MSHPLPPLPKLAELLASGDARILRRVPPVERWDFSPVTGEVVRAAIVDTETTGLGPDDEVIELAILPFEYDKATGRVVRVLPLFVGLRQPSKPIPAAVTAVHGITDEMVAGRNFSPNAAEAALEGVQLVIAHAAKFDRPMCERLWMGPVFEHFPWACSCDEIDWRGMGFSSRSLEHVLLRQGWYFDGHRAADDALATLFLLTLDLPTGGSALAALLANARKPQYVVRVSGTRYEDREVFKRRGGYQWVPATKTWWTMTTDAEAERAWIRDALEILVTIDVRRVSPLERYRGEP